MARGYSYRGEGRFVALRGSQRARRVRVGVCVRARMRGRVCGCVHGCVCMGACGDCRTAGRVSGTLWDWVRLSGCVWWSGLAVRLSGSRRGSLGVVSLSGRGLSLGVVWSRSGCGQDFRTAGGLRDYSPLVKDL